ncbi:MAG: hypothetical protein ACYTHN_25045 [Planctomycetota bacterium]|jgi:hypothetical protein
MFRLDPKVPWDQITGGLEDGTFCIRIPKRTEFLPNSTLNEKRKAGQFLLESHVRGAFGRGDGNGD